MYSKVLERRGYGPIPTHRFKRVFTLDETIIIPESYLLADCSNVDQIEDANILESFKDGIITAVETVQIPYIATSSVTDKRHDPLRPEGLFFERIGPIGSYLHYAFFTEFKRQKILFIGEGKTYPKLIGQLKKLCPGVFVNNRR